MLSIHLTPRLGGPLARQAPSNATVRLVAYGGAIASLLDGITTFIGLRGQRAGEVNTFQAFAIQRFGLSTVIEVRVLAGAAIFVVSAALFSRWSGWQRRVLVGVAAIGLFATVAFVCNNAGVLILHHHLVPPSLLNAMDTQAKRLF